MATTEALVPISLSTIPIGKAEAVVADPAVPDAPTECGVCVDKFTSWKRRPIKCHSCDFPVCRNCVHTYLISLSGAPKCCNPSCAKEWSRRWVVEQMGHSWVAGALRDRRKQVLWEKLQAILPEISARIAERRDLIEIECEASQKELDRVDPLKKQATEDHDTSHNLFSSLTYDLDRALRYNLLDEHETKDTADLLLAESIGKAESLKEILLSAINNAKAKGDLNRLIRFHKDRIRSHDREKSYMKNCSWEAWTELLSGEKRERKTRKRYMVMKCPVDDCNGYVSNYWSCDLCKQKVCKHCREAILFTLTAAGVAAEKKRLAKEAALKAGQTEAEAEVAALEAEQGGDEEVPEEDEVKEGEEGEEVKESNEKDEVKEGETVTTKKRKDKLLGHVCNPATVETVKLLAKDTHACPKCTTLITKIEGCDQMWCTQCQTAFSWTTGEIEKGRVHNPHFYEYQRAHSATGEIPREVGDNPCAEGLQDFYYAMNENAARRYIGTQMYMYLGRAHRYVMDLHEDKLPRERRVLQENGGHNHDLGMGYLQKTKTQADVRSELTLRERRIDLSQSLIDIIDMAWVVMGDLMRRVPKYLSQRQYWSGSAGQQQLPNNHKRFRVCENWIDEVINLLKYVTDELKQVMADHKRKGTNMLFKDLPNLITAVEELPYHQWKKQQQETGLAVAAEDDGDD